MGERIECANAKIHDKSWITIRRKLRILLYDQKELGIVHRKTAIL